MNAGNAFTTDCSLNEWVKSTMRPDDKSCACAENAKHTATIAILDNILGLSGSFKSYFFQTIDGLVCIPQEDE